MGSKGICKYPFRRETEGNIRRKGGNGATKAEIRVAQPEVKEPRQLPEAGRAKNRFVHKSLWREGHSAHTLISAQ